MSGSDAILMIVVLNKCAPQNLGKTFLVKNNGTIIDPSKYMEFHMEFHLIKL